MNIDDLSFVPFSDEELEDVSVVTEHNNLIKDNRFSDATALLDEKKYPKGFVASLFTYFEQKIKDIQLVLLNKTAAPDELYSYTEPTAEQMKGKMFWIKPID